ncbi:MAG: hypothetical protein IJ211_02675 [Campylobacter sp.]|nr:hypothetical protein [Campylobacter sp.]
MAIALLRYASQEMTAYVVATLILLRSFRSSCNDNGSEIYKMIMGRNRYKFYKKFNINFKGIVRIC